MDMKNIDSLPFDVFVEIFQFLPFEDLVSSVQYVNKHWCSIAQDPLLWRDISFKPYLGMHTDHVVELLKQAPLLRSFEFQDGLKADEIYDALCKYNSHIVSLAFETFEMSNDHVRKLVNAYPDLEFLQVPLTVFVNNMNVLGKLRKLKTVKCVQIFYQNGRFSGESDCRFDETDWPALEALDLYSEHIDEDFEQLMEHVRGKLLSLEMQTVCTSSFLNHIPHCVSLERLKLNFMSRQILNPDLEELFMDLKKLVNLKYLNLASFVHTNPAVLCKLFQKASFSKLTELNLCHCLNFTQRVATDIVSSCSKLEIIRLKGCVTLDDLCVQEFSQLSHLSILDISGCPAVTEIGLQFLPECRHLRELNISWNGLVSCAILEIIANLKNLKILHLDHTEVNSAHLVDVAKRLDHLRLLCVYGTRGVNGQELQEMLPRCLVRYSKKDLYSILKEKANILQTLHLCGVSQNILKVLPEYRNLEELNVDFLMKPCYQFAKAFSALKTFGKLRKLSFRGFVQTEDNQLCTILGGNGLAQLQELELEHCLSVDQDVAVFIVKQYPHLERLSLVGCVGLNNNGLAAIVKIEGLDTLNISGCCGISMAGFLHLEKCKNLWKLILYVSLPETELVDVLNCVLSLPKLRILAIKSNANLEKFMKEKKWVILRKFQGDALTVFGPSVLSGD